MEVGSLPGGGVGLPASSYLNEIEGLIDFYAEPFVGREDDISWISSFAASRAPGYMLVESAPGYGKSALFAQLVRLHQTARWTVPRPDLICFFVRHEGQRDTAASFLWAVNSQLLEALGDAASVAIGVDDRRRQFQDLWRRAVQAAGPARPLLLLVDGLDEMAADAPTIAQLLPADLGPYVHGVVTSRPHPSASEQVAGDHPLATAGRHELGPLAPDDLERLMIELGATPEQARSWAPQLSSLTGGHALLARFLCEDVAGRGGDAVAAWDVAPPSGVQEYFAAQLAQLEAHAEGGMTKDVLGLLVHSHGGMTVAELAGALATSVSGARSAVAPLRRYLLGGERLELMHLQLRRLLEARFTPSERQRYRRILTEWCRGFAEDGWPDETPDYVLAHYAAHLVDAGERDRLYTLIDRRWMDLKAARTHSHRGFADDVLLAVDQAGSEQPPNVAQEIRGLLILATLASLAVEVPADAFEALALRDQVAKAEGMAALMADPVGRVEALCAVGTGICRRDRDRALGFFARAASIAQRTTSVHGLEEVARAAGRAGLRAMAADAAESASSIVDAVSPVQRDSAIGAAVIALAYAGEPERSLDMCSAIESDASRAAALWGTLGAVAETRQQAWTTSVAELAEQAAGAVADEGMRAYAQAKLATVLAEGGEQERARRLAAAALARHKADPRDFQAVKIAAPALARAGDLQAALAVADAYGDDGELAVSVLSARAISLARASRSAEARPLVGRALDLLGAIGRHGERIVEGTYRDDQDLRSYDVCGSETTKELAASQVVGALIEIGDFDWAAVVVASVGTRRLRPRVLGRLGRAMARAGADAAADAVLAQLFALVAAPEARWGPPRPSGSWPVPSPTQGWQLRLRRQSAPRWPPSKRSHERASGSAPWPTSPLLCSWARDPTPGRLGTGR